LSIGKFSPLKELSPGELKPTTRFASHARRRSVAVRF